MNAPAWHHNNLGDYLRGLTGGGLVVVVAVVTAVVGVIVVVVIVCQRKPCPPTELRSEYTLP